jgi:hypothetical protein
MTTTDDIRVANLRQAAKRKQADAEARARLAIKNARKAQQPVTFRGIAEAAGVSTSYLYSNPEVRAQIETAPKQHSGSQPSNPPPPAKSRRSRPCSMLPPVREPISCDATKSSPPGSLSPTANCSNSAAGWAAAAPTDGLAMWT